MVAERRKPVIGDECWEVRWCHASWLDEDGITGDPDRDSYTVKDFKTHAAAMAYAKKVYPKCCHGVVNITPMQFVPYDEADAARYPHAGYWEATGDTEFYEGEANA